MPEAEFERSFEFGAGSRVAPMAERPGLRGTVIRAVRMVDDDLAEARELIDGS